MARRSLCSQRLARAATLSAPAVGLLLAACRAQITGVDVRTVDLDGRISFWCDGTGDGFAMRDCLRQASKGGPMLPEAIFDVRPKGGS